MGNKQTLLPCPFCGGKAKLRTGRAAEDAEYAQVTCGGCSTSTDFFEDAYAPTEDAAHAWNRRAAVRQVDETTGTSGAGQHGEGI
jgi:Lar family restriction alleviation protein